MRRDAQSILAGSVRAVADADAGAGAGAGADADAGAGAGAGAGAASATSLLRFLRRLLCWLPLWPDWSSCCCC